MTWKQMRMRLAAFLLSGAAMLMIAAPADAADEWKYDGDFYMWMPQMEIGLPDDGQVTIKFDDILKNLKMVFMGGFGATKGKWSLNTDVIYMKLTDSDSILKSLSGYDLDAVLDVKVSMKSWIVTPTVGYSLVDNEKGSFKLFGGARYLMIETPVSLTLTVGGATQTDSLSPEGSNWDGIVGVKGDVILSPEWYAEYYLDAGTGDSKSTWQGYAGVAYRFNKVDVHAGYRYLNYEFQSSRELEDLTVKGPLIGVTWMF